MTMKQAQKIAMEISDERICAAAHYGSTKKDRSLRLWGWGVIPRVEQERIVAAICDAIDGVVWNGENQASVYIRF